MSKQMHCWFSKKMHETVMSKQMILVGDIYYHINGIPTVVTLATPDKKHNCTWDDMEYLGVGTFAYNKKSYSSNNSETEKLNPQELIDD